MHRAELPRRVGRDPGSATTGTVRATRGTWLAIVAAALLIAVAGTALQVRAKAAAGSALRDTGSLGGLTARPHDAGWLGMDSHDMNTQGGYQMPAQMMPGAPVGDDMRLGIPITLLNTDTQVREFNVAEEFSLGGGRNDEPRRLHSDTFGQLARLNPGNAIDGVLYFDTVVPSSTDAPLYLLWKRDGRTVRLAVPLSGGMPDHEHSP